MSTTSTTPTGGPGGPGGDGPDNRKLLEQTRLQINRLIEEVARLSESEIPPSDFYAEMLKRTLSAMAAPVGAVWTLSEEGALTLQFQINIQEVGFNQNEAARNSHDELLREAIQQPQPTYLLPQSGRGSGGSGQSGAANLTRFVWLLVPIISGTKVVGLIEVWQSPERPRNAIPGFLQFMTSMAEMAARYTRNRNVRQLSGQQEVWTQLEAFTRLIHASLKPVEVSYQVANEGRRLIDCDRLSVGIREGRKARVEAVSGSDVVEKRSNLIVRMRNLFDAVLEWDDKLVYTGEKDESLPPKVVDALDRYLAESNSKLLVCQPLRDEREKSEDGKTKMARSALLMESFEPTEDTPQLLGKLEVVGNHSATALYNSIQYRRIPMKWVWLPLAKAQEGVGGRARAIWTLVFLLLVAFGSLMYLASYPLTMEVDGQLQPTTRVVIYPEHVGEIKKVLVNARSRLHPGDQLFELYDNSLAAEMARFNIEVQNANGNIRTLDERIKQGDLQAIQAMTQAKKDLDIAQKRRKHYEDTLFVRSGGAFYSKAPEFEEIEKKSRLEKQKPRSPDSKGNQVWSVLTDEPEKLKNTKATLEQPLVELADLGGPWHAEIKIKQQHVGQVLKAFEYLKRDWLWVDILVRSETTGSYKGVLYRKNISGKAVPDRTDNDEPSPVVKAWVLLDDDKIADHGHKQIPRRLYQAGVQVTTKIDCGDHRMGYSLFYGVWEFFYEKILFRL